MFVQFVHCLDIGIGLADARFHLDGQIIFPFQFRRWLDLVHPLDFLYMGEDGCIRQFGNDLLVAPSCEIFIIQKGSLVICTHIHHIGWCEVWLPCEHVHDSLCSIRLKFLVFEPKSHMFSPISKISSRILSPKSETLFRFLILPILYHLTETYRNHFHIVVFHRLQLFEIFE